MARQSNKKYAICNAIPGGQPFGLQPVASPSPSPRPCPSPIQNRGRVAGGGNVFLPPPAINCAGISLCQGRFLNEVPKLGLVSWQALDVELVFGHRSQVDATTRCRWWLPLTRRLKCMFYWTRSILTIKILCKF